MCFRGGKSTSYWKSGEEKVVLFQACRDFLRDRYKWRKVHDLFK